MTDEKPVIESTSAEAPSLKTNLVENIKSKLPAKPWKLAAILVGVVLVFIFFSESVPRVGETFTAEVEYNANAGKLGGGDKAIETELEITVLSIQKSVGSGGHLVRADVRVKNLGKRAIQFSHSFAQIRDAEGRRYKGKSASEMARRARSSMYFINLEPGFGDSNYVYFTLPFDAFDGDIHFGFTSVVDEDAHQARVLIFEDGKVAFASKD